MPRSVRARSTKTRPVEITKTGRGQPIRGRLQLEKNGSAFLAPARVDLLEAIGAHGSISAAAKAVGLSYKAAWDAVDAMNNQSPKALVSRSVGGSHGGGTQLTDYGRRVLSLVRRIEREYADVVQLLEEPGSALAEYSQLQRRLSLCSSARNQWVGRVTQVTLGMVRAEVHLALGSQPVRASLSAASVQRLGIAPGAELCMLVKATAIRLQLAGGRVDLRGADLNHLQATVVQITPGLDQIEVTARLQEERSVTAVVGASSAPWLHVGTKVVASFAPEHVLLVQLHSDG